MIWQQRVEPAFEAALNISGKGFNIFISGAAGSGRYQTIIELLRKTGNPENKIPPDIIFLYDFKQIDRPHAIFLPPGAGRQLKKTMDELIENFKKNIPALLDSDAHRKRVSRINDEFRDMHRGLLKEFEAKIHSENFAAIQPEDNPYAITDIMPVIAGNKVAMDKIEELVELGQYKKRDYDRLKNKYIELSMLLEIISRRYSELEKQFY